MDANQGTPDDHGPELPSSPPSPVALTDAGYTAELARLAEAERAAAALERRIAADGLGGRVRQGLTRWLVIAVAGAAVAALSQHPDAAMLLAVAAMFALTQSWDVRDRARDGELAGEPGLEPATVGLVLRMIVPIAVPVLAAGGYVLFGVYARSLPTTVQHVDAMRWCWAAAAACMAMTIPALARPITRSLFPYAAWSNTTRLSASIALGLLLLPVPARLVMDEMIDLFTSTGRPLVDVGSLVSQLVGEVALAAAAVGLWVARDGNAMRERLGLTAMRGRHVVVALVGLGLVIAVNSGMEAIEHARFPALWAADQEMGRLIAGELNVAASILLGVSAGVGEEVLVRGALQPRAGLFWASLLFTAGHVQYTWFGMITILLLGVALGIVRARANTTTAIVVHALYDILAAISAK
jgi:membrane protease YdiL (CAAX protease family)